VAANVALLLKLFGQDNLRHNAQLALETIRSGTAFERVTALAARG
ncbi:MAG: anthranilate phosphoribosyltransferase, partial [Hafnia sp.]